LGISPIPSQMMPVGRIVYTRQALSLVPALLATSLLVPPRRPPLAFAAGAETEVVTGPTRPSLFSYRIND
jgi:hypothetical protein